MRSARSSWQGGVIAWTVAALAWALVAASWLWVAVPERVPDDAALLTTVVVHVAADAAGGVWEGSPRVARAVPPLCQREVALQRAGGSWLPAQRPSWSRSVPTPSRVTRPWSPVSTYVVAYVRDDELPYELLVHAEAVELLVQAEAARSAKPARALAVAVCSLAAHSALLERRWSDAQDAMRHVTRGADDLDGRLARMIADVSLLATPALCNGSRCNESLGSALMVVLRDVDPLLVPSDGVPGISRWHMLRLPSELILPGAVTDLRGLQHAAHLTSLTVQHLESAELPPLDLAPLAAFDGLRNLVLGQRTVASLVPLRGHESLQRLSLHGTSFARRSRRACDADPLAPVGDLALTHLAAPHVQTSVACFGMWAMSTSLSHLDVSGHSAILERTAVPAVRAAFPLLETMVAVGAAAEVIESVEAPLLRRLEAPWPTDGIDASTMNRAPILDRFERLESADLSRRTVDWASMPFSSTNALQYLVLTGVDLPENQDRWSDSLPAALQALDLSAESAQDGDVCAADGNRLMAASLPAGLKWLKVGGRCIIGLGAYQAHSLRVLCTHGAQLHGAPGPSSLGEPGFTLEAWFLRYQDTIDDRWSAWLDSVIERSGQTLVIDSCPGWQPT